MVAWSRAARRALRTSRSGVQAPARRVESSSETKRNGLPASRSASAAPRCTASADARPAPYSGRLEYTTGVLAWAGVGTVTATVAARAADRITVWAGYPGSPTVRRDGPQCRRTRRQARPRRDHRDRQADLQPGPDGTAHRRGLPEGRRPPALDGADRRDRRLDRRAAPAARPRPPAAGRGVRRGPRAVRGALACLRAPLPLRRAQRADPPAQRVVPDRARPADGPAHARLRADQRPLVPPGAAHAGVGARAVPRGLSAPTLQARGRL